MRSLMLILVLSGVALPVRAAEPVTIQQTIPYASDAVGTPQVRSCQWNTELSDLVVKQARGDVVTTDKDLSQVTGPVLELGITEVHSVSGGEYSGGKWASVHGRLRDGTKLIGEFDTTAHTVHGTWTNCGTLSYLGKALAGDIAEWAGTAAYDPMALLQSADPAEVKHGARILYLRSSLDRATLDTLGALISREKATQDDKLADALSWGCRVLGKSGQGQYKVFLQQIADSAASAKLREYAHAASSTLPDGSKDVYGAEPPPAQPVAQPHT